MSNAYWEPLDFELPPVPQTAMSGWQRWIDTARESPEDIMDPPAAPLVAGTRISRAPRSMVALFVVVDAGSGAALKARERPEPLTWINAGDGLSTDHCDLDNTGWR